MRRCPASASKYEPHTRNKYISANTNSRPYFPAVIRGNLDEVLRVEICSGSPINLVKQSTAEALGLEIVVDDFGYDDYVDAPQSFVFPSGVVGLSCFTLVHTGYKLWFDGFVIEDDVGLVIDDMHVDILAGAPFMEQNDISVRPSKHRISFGDSKVFTYGGYESQTTCTCVVSPPRTSTSVTENENECVDDYHETDTEFIHTIHVHKEHSEMVTDHDHETECEHDEVHTVVHPVETEFVINRDDIEHDHHRDVKVIKRTCTFPDNENVMESECEFIEIEMERSHVEQRIECRFNAPKETGCDGADFPRQTVCVGLPESAQGIISESEFEHSQIACEHHENAAACEHCPESSCLCSASEQADDCSKFSCKDTGCSDCDQVADRPRELLGCDIATEPDSSVFCRSADASPIDGLNAGYVITIPCTEHTVCCRGIPGTSSTLTECRSEMDQSSHRSCDGYFDDFHVTSIDFRGHMFMHVHSESCQHTSVDITGSQQGATPTDGDCHHSTSSPARPTCRHPTIDAEEPPDHRLYSDVTGDLPPPSRTADDDDPLTPLANRDTLGLRQLSNDVGPLGPTYFDVSPAWSPYPWTCGPRPPSFVTEGGLCPCPRGGATSPVDWMMATARLLGPLRAPPHGIAHRLVDLNFPPVLRILHPRHPQRYYIPPPPGPHYLSPG